MDDEHWGVGHGVTLDQIGSRYRRMRTAAARQNAATMRPIHNPGVLKNVPGVSDASGSKWAVPFSSTRNALLNQPPSRSPRNVKNDALPKTIFVKTPIARNGMTAHKNVARFAQPDTSSNQQ